MTASVRAPLAGESSATRLSARRPPWRRRLIDLERGLALGLRGSAVLFVHLFCAISGVAAAVVLGVSARDWALLLLCFSGSVAAELMHHAVVALSQTVVPDRADAAKTAVRLSAAAATLMMAGGIAAAGIVLLHRAANLWEA